MVDVFNKIFVFIFDTILEFKPKERFIIIICIPHLNPNFKKYNNLLFSASLGTGASQNDAANNGGYNDTSSLDMVQLGQYGEFVSSEAVALPSDVEGKTLRDVKVMPDGWTVLTCDGSLSAHFEHTIAITPDGPQIMTIV